MELGNAASDRNLLGNPGFSASAFPNFSRHFVKILSRNLSPPSEVLLAVQDTSNLENCVFDSTSRGDFTLNYRTAGYVQAQRTQTIDSQEQRALSQLIAQDHPRASNTFCDLRGNPGQDDISRFDCLSKKQRCICERIGLG